MKKIFVVGVMVGLLSVTLCSNVGADSNLALTGTAFAHPYRQYGPAANAIDGDPTTVWQHGIDEEGFYNAFGFYPYLIVELEGLASIGQINVISQDTGDPYTNENIAPNDYNIWTSPDGVNYTLEVSVTDNTDVFAEHLLDCPVLARFVMIEILRQDWANDLSSTVLLWVTLGELEVIGDFLNVALGGSASADGYRQYGPAANAIDGDPTTVWQHGYRAEWNYQKQGFYPYLKIDLGSVQTVNRIAVVSQNVGDAYTNANIMPNDYTISVSTDDSTYTQVVNVTGNTLQVADHVITPIQARYVNLVITAQNWGNDCGGTCIGDDNLPQCCNGLWVTLGELEVYALQDADGDGYDATINDYNDNDATIYPGSTEHFASEGIIYGLNMTLCDPDIINVNSIYTGCQTPVPANHGEYVSCVAHAADVLLTAGRINDDIHSLIVSTAAKSEIGKKPKGQRGRSGK